MSGRCTTIQIRIFSGTLGQIEQEFNKWAARLVQGAQIQAQPIMPPNEHVDHWTYMIIVNLPAQGNGIAVAQQMPTPIREQN